MDRIDLKILQLLQQRTKLSGRIGETKRRHGAVIYVPERERELLARISRRSKGKLPARAVTAIYREILSSSRAAQGQAPIGLLSASAGLITLPGRWCFGACDQFLPKKTWTGVAAGLEAGALALALLTGEDLARVVRTPGGRHDFFGRWSVVGDFPSSLEAKTPLARRIFIVMPRGKGAACVADRILILIECKSMVNALKSLLNSMPDRPLAAELLPLRARPARNGNGAALVRLKLARPTDGIHATSHVLTACKSVAIQVSILGVYPGTENYGG